jgi:hypothetical protein
MGLWATRIIGIKVDASGATTFALARGAVAGGSKIDLATAALALGAGWFLSLFLGD